MGKVKNYLSGPDKEASRGWWGRYLECASSRADPKVLARGLPPEAEGGLARVAQNTGLDRPNAVADTLSGGIPAQYLGH